MSEMNDEFFERLHWWSPEHAEAIERALEGLVSEINQAIITGLGSEQHFAVIEHCVARLRYEITAEMDAELRLMPDLQPYSEPPPPDEDPDDEDPDDEE